MQVPQGACFFCATILLMIIVVLLVTGLCFGSFVNALVYRLYTQASQKPKVKKSKAATASTGSKAQGLSTFDFRLSTKSEDRYSILHGRSMCPHCKHELSALDLLPVVSWLWLRGKCRYCGKRISVQYPLVELATAALFVVSYLWWPVAFSVAQTAIFILWSALLVGFMALIVYDLRWKLLPNRIMYPLSVVAALMALIAIITAHNPLTALINTFFGVLVGGGIFYVLFQVSKGKWIGGGDVKLGWLLGLVAGTPARSVLFIFLAALLGSLISVFLLLTKRLQRNSTIPFGPFLIIGAIIVQLFGHAILLWYQRAFLPFSI